MHCPVQDTHGLPIGSMPQSNGLEMEGLELPPILGLGTNLGPLLLGDHNLTIYNHSKNGHTWHDIKCHQRFECVFLITNWF